MKTFMSLKQKFTTLFLTSLTVLSVAFPVMAATVCPPGTGTPHEEFFSPQPNYDTTTTLKKSDNPEEFQRVYDKFVEKFGPAPFEVDAFYITESKDRTKMAIVFEGAGCVKNASMFDKKSKEYFFGQEM